MRKKIVKTFVNSELMEVKTENRDGIEVGIVEGYIATWDLDRGDGWTRDQFVKGAFKKSIRDLKKRNRPLRLKDHHGRTIGGFPANTLKEDERGLFGRGEINLEVQQGREAYSLAKQGILTDFSVGFSIVKSSRDEQNDIRTITESNLWEGSIVDEPMNPFAQITGVKNEGREMEEVNEEEVKTMTKRDLEKALRSGREFTKQAAVAISSLFDGVAPPETEEAKTIRLEQERKDREKIEEEQDEKDFEDFSKSLKELSKPFGKEVSA